MNDRIFLYGLEVEAVIGIYDWEQEVHQKVLIDLEMAIDARKVAKSDRIDDALNYKSVAKRLLEWIPEQRLQLVETLAENIARIVITEFDVEYVRVRVGKPGAIRHAQNVGVEIERCRKDFLNA